MDAVQITTALCISDQEFRRLVGVWLRKSTLDQRIGVSVRADAELLVFAVEREGEPTGERIFPRSGAACFEWMAGVSLAIAVAIDSTTLRALEEEAHASSLDKASAPPAVRTETSAAAPRLEVTLSAEAGALFGTLPTPAWGVRAAVELRSLFLLDVRVAVLGTGESRFALGSGELGLAMLGAEALLCLPNLSSSVRIRLCLGPAIAAVRSEAYGFEGARNPSSLWVATAGRVDAEVPITSTLGAVLAVEAHAPAVRPKFGVTRGEEDLVAVRRLPPLGLGLSTGLRLTF